MELFYLFDWYSEDHKQLADRRCHLPYHANVDLFTQISTLL